MYAGSFSDRGTGLSEQPRRKPAVVPLRADVRSRPDDGVQPFGRDEIQEATEVTLPGRVELSALG